MVTESNVPKEYTATSAGCLLSSVRVLCQTASCLSLRISRWSFPLLLILIVTSSCGMFEQERRTSIEIEFYAIDPNTLINDLAQGGKDVFVAQDESPYEASPTFGEPVQWSPADYFQIAQALHTLVWGESLDEWNLRVISYNMDCGYLTNGPQDAVFAYCRLEQLGGDETRWVSKLSIEPRRNTVAALKEEYYPHQANQQALDLSQLKISAADALEIAERNGGYETRMAVENMCGIYIILNTDSLNDDWKVRYYPDVINDSDTLAYYDIDPLTGEIENNR